MTNLDSEKISPTEEEKAALYDRIKVDAEQSGYHINPDKGLVWILMNGLLVNEKRFGYQSCPCRLGANDIEIDRDIICPCDYRDADVQDFDGCYCSLYVSTKILTGEVQAHSIPERRPALSDRPKIKSADAFDVGALTQLAYPVWRCSVCGYLCARESAPEICPICKASHDRFERFL